MIFVLLFFSCCLSLENEYLPFSNNVLKKESKFVFSKALLKEEVAFLKLYIPRINLEENVYTIDSVLNDVDWHVQILKDSVPTLNVFFLAAHSGRGVASYFNQLVYLENGDLIWLFYHGEWLLYVVTSKFYIQKNGYIETDEVLENILFLITCSLEYSDKQLVIEADLIR